uniref:DUF4178 domain-containing protein n=1 Tax=Strongyloides venezuelensis TaxID=75913 RepID=A0A0K0G640_STRVS
MYKKGRFSRNEQTVVYRDRKSRNVVSELENLNIYDVELQSGKDYDVIDEFLDLFNIKNSISHSIISIIFGMVLGLFIVIYFQK